MNKWFIGILALVIAVLVGVFVLGNRSGNDRPQPADQDPQVVSSQDHIRGNVDAKVTLIEYGDFQCPACGAFYPLTRQLEQEYGDRVRLVFRHFPLSEIHPNAFAGSRAAEASTADGKFFAMHDLLYERQKQWSSDTNVQKIFREYAKELGMDANAFNERYGSNDTTDRINQDIKSGKTAGADSTPSLYLNGQKLDPNPRSYEELKAKIEEALAKAT